MKRKVLLQLVVPLLGLWVLFLLLAGEPEQGRRQEPVEVSVILREADSSGWAAARQGMEQAAGDLGAELRFLILSQAGSAEEQRTLLDREVSAGADAVVLAPVDRAALSEAVAQAAQSAVVVTMETDLGEFGAAACVGVDNDVLGRSLAEAAMRGVPAGGGVLLVDSLPGDNAVKERLEAAATALEDAGRTVLRSGARGEQTLAEALAADLRATRPEAVVAFDAMGLETAARTAHGLETAPLVYGMGATSTIAAYLEQNDITAIVTQNEFSAGYLAVRSAVQAVGKTLSGPSDPLAFSMVRRETMYEPENQKLLFPVTR